MISSFRNEVNEIYPLLEYYAAYSGNCLPTFFLMLVFLGWGDFLKGLIGCPEIILFFSLDFLTLENGTNRLSRNVRKELPLHAA